MRFLLLFTLLSPFVSFSMSYDTIEVGMTTTVHLNFPSEVISYDLGLGNDDVFVSKSSDNHLKLGAGIRNFQTTNLYVETPNNFYNFIIKYVDFPESQFYNISIDKSIESKHPKQKSGFLIPKKPKVSSIDSISNFLIKNNEGFYLDGLRYQKLTFSLLNIYTVNNQLYFTFKIKNEANIPYNFSHIGFLIFRKGKGKDKGLIQEKLIEPKKMVIVNQTILKGEEMDIVFVFDKFTLEKKKKLKIQLWEEEGERYHTLMISSTTLLNAQKL